MAEPNTSPFREKSLERLSSPERLDQMLQLVDRRSWIPLTTLGTLILLMLVWSIVGRIPINVHGKGVLVQPRKILELQSASSGHLARLNVSVGDRVKAQDVMAVLSRPDLDKQLELQRQKRLDLVARAAAAKLLRSKRTDLENASTAGQGKTLRRHINSSRSLAEEIKARELKAIEVERAVLEQQGRLAGELPERLLASLESQRELEQDGILSRQDLIRAEEAYLESLRTVSDLEADLRALQTRELVAEEQYLNRVQGLADLAFKMQMQGVRESELAQENLESVNFYEQQILDVDREIARLDVLQQREGRIVSQHDARVLEVRHGVGDVLAPGDSIGSIEVEDADSPLQAMVYFAVSDGKRLKPEDEIHVTPDIVKRERFGSMLGTIVRISPFPVTLEEAIHVIGNPVVAQSLLEGGYLIQAEVELTRDPDTFSRYSWSSSDGPRLEISSGTTATARVAVEDRRPIAFVLPFLRKTTGVD